MNSLKLIDTAHAMVGAGKGLLAMDESNGTCNKRFAALGIAQTEEARRAWRELIVTAPGLGDSISGAILYDETIRQRTKGGTPFVKVLTKAGIIPGIKVDGGTKPMPNFPGEVITEGLDGLPARLAEYHKLGARFAKWRAVIDIGEGIPTRTCIETNADLLARYAALCQEAEIVPIVEPEVLMDGGHSLARCEAVTEEVLTTVFDRLQAQRVYLEGIVLKPNMVISGQKATKRASPAEVAEATLRCLKRHVPSAVPGIAFLSGGQTEQEATLHLDLMNRSGSLPWLLSFSYGRALQQSALGAWGGAAASVASAQAEFLKRARLNSLAAAGRYESALEKQAA